MSEAAHPGEGTIDWTGERCLPWINEVSVIYEHLLRYQFAAHLVAGKRVLDLGSGEGYGSALLAEGAASVVGIELDPDVVQHAIARYQRPNLEFVQGSILDLDRFASGSFDVATCFEVLEHVREHEELMTAVKRVLGDDGILLVSSPDRVVYSEIPDYHNPYHLRELDRDEFHALLSANFADVAIWEQYASASGSLMSAVVPPRRPGRSEVIGVTRDADDWRRVAVAAPYLMAAAAKAELPELPVSSMLWHQDLETLTMEREPVHLSRARFEAHAREIEQLTARLAEAEEGRNQWESRYREVIKTRAWRMAEWLRALRPGSRG